jgi:hypothetical protein
VDSVKLPDGRYTLSGKETMRELYRVRILGSAGEKKPWIYSMVIRPILTYSSTVWWPRVRCNVNRTELSKLQRLVCLAITGAMKTTPTAAMEVLLGLPPLYMMIEAEAQAGIYRLMCTQQ